MLSTVIAIFAKNYPFSMLRKEKIIYSLFLIGIATLAALSGGCNEDENTLPLAPVDVTIDPNSTIYQELNVVGGWLYLGQEDGVEPPSRGLIVHRLTTDQFVAFERTPPFEPDSCCTPSGTNCSRLTVGNNYPFIVDTCTGSRYLIIDGSVVESPSNMPLGMYFTEYYGDLLYIHN
jgi:hypothetical protein